MRQRFGSDLLAVGIEIRSAEKVMADLAHWVKGMEHKDHSILEKSIEGRPVQPPDVLPYRIGRAAPRPFFPRRHQPRLHRVIHYVLDHLFRIFAATQHMIVITALPERPDNAMRPGDVRDIAFVVVEDRGKVGPVLRADQ